MVDLQIAASVVGSIPGLTGLGDLQRETLGDPGIRVGVLDGPVDISHASLRGAQLRKLDTLVPGEVGDGPMSVHGTHVASIIFGQPGTPVPGVAPGCTGLIAPIFHDDQAGRLSQLDLARAIEQVVEAGAHIINISGGELAPSGQPEGALAGALRLCNENNVLVVAAAGNDGCECLHVPAAVPSVLAVGALGADGRPLETSNWGAAYHSNGVLAPGERILGAAPGDRVVRLSGSSFATPVVAGVAALLLSMRRRNDQAIDPRTIRRAILDAAVPCQPRGSPDCARYLTGTLNVPGAYALSKQGGTTVSESHVEPNPPPAPFAPLGAAEMHIGGEPAMAAAGAGVTPSMDTTGVDASNGAAPSTMESGPRAADQSASTLGAADRRESTLASAQITDTSSNGRHHADPAGIPGSFGRNQLSTVHPSAVQVNGIQPSCDCNCQPDSAANIFAIGEIGFDFPTEARRDTFRQLMPFPEFGSPPIVMPPNPYDVNQLADYLDANPSESTKLVWTLNLDLTPIYALEAEVSSYADEVYHQFRTALRNQALPNSDPNYVSRVSIPGKRVNRTVRLFSGQVVPVVVVQPRGLYVWSENALVDLVVDVVQRERPDNFDADYVRLTVRQFLDKVYYQLRNLGQTSADRALNFAATNAFVFTQGIADGILSARVVPGPQADKVANFYSLDTIGVTKSSYCRIDSDCWDVQIMFFDPENVLRARAVFQSTLDVSDEMPVQLAPTHQFLVSSSDLVNA